MSRRQYQTLQDLAQFPLIPNVFAALDQNLAHVLRAQDLALELTSPLEQEVAKARAQFSDIESLVASSLKRFTEEFTKIDDHLRSIAGASNFLGESYSPHGLEEIKRRTDSIVETFQQSFSSTFAIQESFNRTLTFSHDFQKELSQLLPHSLGQEVNRLVQFAATLPTLGISVSPEGILSIGSESVPVDDIRNNVEELLGRQEIRNFQEFLRQLLAKTKGFSPSLRAFFVLIALHIMFLTRDISIEIFAPYVNEYLIEHGHLSKREATKTINENVTRQIPVELLQDFRFVKASELKMRESPSKNSPQVGVVYFSEVVRIVKEKKDWTLVERQSEDNEVLIRGWVYTRYLAKFKTRVSPSTTKRERLSRLDSEESPNPFDKEFLQAAEFVLEKNEELYRRLA